VATHSGKINLASTNPKVRYYRNHNCVLKEGQKINTYQIIENIGEGPFASLYLVKDTESAATLALKLFDKDFTGNNAAQEEFLEQVQKIAPLNYPALVKYYEAGIYEGYCFPVMDYLVGGSLKNRLRDKTRLPEKEGLEIIQTVASALAAAYAQCQIFHGNLKPENILFNRKDEAVVTDYALTSWLTKYFLNGEPITLPHYISPELVINKQGIWSTDVYSLGILFYQIITGTFPFNSPRDEEILQMHVENPLPKPDKRQPDTSISDNVMTILCRMTAKNPAGRYDSWNSFLQDIFLVIKDLGKSPESKGGKTTVLMPAPAPKLEQPKASIGKSAKLTKKIIRR
jgi:serine/threonine-protein kinase